MRVPDFTAVEDLVLCKAYAAVSEDPNVGTDQTAETFWGKVLRALFCSLDMRLRAECSMSILQFLKD